jgi:hypothetical protein
VAGGAPCAYRWAATAQTGRFIYTAASPESRFITIDGRAFSLMIESDRTGADSAAQARVYKCTTTDGDGDGVTDVLGCQALMWDTDNNGSPDDNLLDVTNVMKTGTPVFLGIPFVYIDPIADPGGTGIAEVTISAETR